MSQFEEIIIPIARAKWSVKHGESKSPEYVLWRNMQQRCYNIKNTKYHLYGGRGIKVCSEWRDNFLTFLAYVGRKPTSLHSLDRFPNPNGNYEPGNVRWATAKEQAESSRRPIILEFNGIKQSLEKWSEQTGIKIHTIYTRIYSYDWSIEKALTTLEVTEVQNIVKHRWAKHAC